MVETLEARMTDVEHQMVEMDAWRRQIGSLFQEQYELAAEAKEDHHFAS